MFLIWYFTKFTGSTIGIGKQLALLNNSTTQSGTDGKTNEVRHRLPFTEVSFAEGKTIGIIINKNRNRETLGKQLFQVNLLPIRYICHIVNNAGTTVNHTWYSYTYGKDFLIEDL